MRTRMLLLLALVGLALGFAPAPFPKRGPRKADPHRMDGAWTVSTGHVDGVANYSSTSRSTGLSASKGDLVQITPTRLTFPAKANLVTDWIIQPGAGNAIDLLGPAPGNLRLLGIYRVEKDTLSPCVGDQGRPRPTQFVGGSWHNLVILKRRDR